MGEYGAATSGRFGRWVSGRPPGVVGEARRAPDIVSSQPSSARIAAPPAAALAASVTVDGADGGPAARMGRSARPMRNFLQ